MLQVLRKGLKEVVIEDVPEPRIGKGEVKIKTAYSLISTGTEIAGLHPQGLVKEVIHGRNKITGIIGKTMRSQGPLKTAGAIIDKFSELSITGYSGAGIIIGRSDDVGDLEIGQGVAYGGVETGHAEVVCAHRNLVVPVPNGVSLKQASLATLGSIALHAVRKTRIGLGDTVAVIGLGLIGQLVVQLCRISGARVFGMDIRDDRMREAMTNGAEITVSALENPESVINGMTGGHGVDAVIVCASSANSQPLDTAIEIARSRARVIVVGMVKMEMPWERLFLKELQLTVSRAYGPGSYDPTYEKEGLDYPIDYVRWTENRNMAEFLRILDSGKIDAQSIITNEFPLEEAPAAYRQLASKESNIVGAVLRYPSAESRGAGDLGEKTKLSVSTGTRKRIAKPGILRVGIVGLGNITRWAHLPNVQGHPKLMLQGVCTPKGYRAKYFGKRFKAEYCTTDYKKVIEDPEIDIVMICTRNNLHARIALEALDAGKHVFVEKPMALNQEDCLKLVQRVRETGLGFMVNYNRRYSKMYQRAKEAVSGRGAMMMTFRMNNPDMKPSYWMMDRGEGGGAVLGEGCHIFDLMAWFAESEPLSAFAQRVVFPSDEISGKNNIACILPFENGSIGNFIYETIGHNGMGSERGEISANGVTAVVDDMRRLTIWKGSTSLFSRPKKKRTFVAEKGYYGLLNALIDGIHEGRSFEADVIAGARATLCALAAIQSFESGRPEKIEIL